MFLRIFFLIIILMVSFGVDPSCAQDAQEELATTPEISQPIPNRYIVKFKDSSADTSEIINRFEKKHGIKSLNNFKSIIMGASVDIAPEKLKELLDDSDVETVVQDFTVSALAKPLSSSPPIINGIMSLGMTSPPPQVIPTGIKWIGANLNATNEGMGATVAVLDTGIDFFHPDLMVNTSLSKDFSGDNTGGNDNNRSIKGHGTHVAGVIAALNNNVGVLGTGTEIELVSVKVLNGSGSGSFSSVIAGLDYVTSIANIIGIANLSLGATGGTNPSQGFLDVSMLFQEAVQRAVNAGVIVVVAAGNDGKDVTAYNSIPAMYPEVVSVSALDDRDGNQGNDAWAYFSNYGTEVDIIAPGVNILSTAIGGGTSSLSGTSFSAPHVAGTLGLYIAKNGRPSNGDARLLSSIISSISQSRSPLSGEPADGFTEPSCFANGSSLK